MIEESAFYECNKLKNVQFSEGLEKIGLFSFYETGLENIELPASLRTIA